MRRGDDSNGQIHVPATAWREAAFLFALEGRDRPWRVPPVATLDHEACEGGVPLASDPFKAAASDAIEPLRGLFLA